MASNIEKPFGCHCFTYRWKCYYRFICQTRFICQLFILIESVQMLILSIEDDLQKSLTERGYSEREAQKQILKARGYSRDSLLNRKSTRGQQNKITFNLTYYLVLQNFKKILAELHLLLTPDVAHKAVFTNVPIIGF